MHLWQVRRTNGHCQEGRQMPHMICDGRVCAVGCVHTDKKVNGITMRAKMITDVNVNQFENNFCEFFTEKLTQFMNSKNISFASSLCFLFSIFSLSPSSSFHLTCLSHVSLFSHLSLPFHLSLLTCLSLFISPFSSSSLFFALSYLSLHSSIYLFLALSFLSLTLGVSRCSLSSQ